MLKGLYKYSIFDLEWNLPISQQTIPVGAMENIAIATKHAALINYINHTCVVAVVTHSVRSEKCLLSFVTVISITVGQRQHFGEKYVINEQKWSLYNMVAVLSQLPLNHFIGVQVG